MEPTVPKLLVDSSTIVISTDGHNNTVLRSDQFTIETDQRGRLGEEDLRRDGVNQVTDLDRYDPRIQITQEAGGGNVDIRIRGLGGNRIQATVSGTPLPDPIGGRDTVDPNLLNGVDVLFGPGSSRYGSDAMAGRINFELLRPSDLVSAQKQSAHLVRTFGNSDTQQLGVHGRIARQWDNHGLLGAVTLRKNEEPRAVGEAYQWPQQTETAAGLVAWENRWSERWQTLLSFDGFIENTDVQIREEYFGNERSERHNDRHQLKIAAIYGENPASPWLRLQVYGQVSANDETTLLSDLGNAMDGFDRSRTSTNSFNQDQFGGLMNSVYDNGDLRIVFGAEGHYSASEDWQTSVTALSNGTIIASDPTRSYPVTDAIKGGVFADGQWFVGDSLWIVEAGVRLDAYVLNVSVDEAYKRSLAGQNVPTDLEDYAPTGRIGASYWFSDEIRPYVQLASGYRNGRFDEANQAFTNFTIGYTFAPNPNLKPEQSLGVTSGIRGDIVGSEENKTNYDITVHYTEYKDFIESQFTGTVDNVAAVGPHPTLARYQSVNRDEVIIYGADFVANVDWTANWFSRFGVTYVEGEDQNTGEPIDELSPANMVVSAGWQTADKRLRSELLYRYEARKSEANRSDAYIPPESHVVDVRVSWEIVSQLMVDVAVLNIFDEKYWRWVDVDSVSDDAPQSAIDFYAQPGRHVTATLSYAW